MRDLVEKRENLRANKLGEWTDGRTAGFKLNDPMGSISRMLRMLSALYEPGKTYFC